MIDTRPRPVALILLVALASPLFAGEAPPPNVATELAAAHEAWQRGDQCGERARKAAAGTSARGEYLTLLDEQEKAYETARTSFEAALAKDAQNATAQLDFGRFWLARREFSNARDHLELAWDSASIEGARRDPFTPPEKADMLRTLASLIERAGEVELALLYYKKAFAFDDTDPRNRLSLAIAHCAAGTPNAAITLLAPWSAEAPSPTPDIPKNRPAILALGLYTLGFAEEESGALEPALAHYTAAEAAAIQAGAGDVSEVADKARLSIARIEDLFDFHTARQEQIAKENANRVRHNEELAKKPVDKTMPAPKPLVMLSSEAFEFRQASLACETGIALRKKALESESMRLTLLRARGGVASIDDVQKDPAYATYNEAILKFQEALIKFPKLARAHYELGLSHSLMGRYNAAATHADAAVVYSPNNLSYLRLKGDVLLALGQWQDAVEPFKKALALEPEAGWANFGLARIYAALETDAATIQLALDSLEKATQLGTWDERMTQAQVLTLHDGREIEGRVKEVKDPKDKTEAFLVARLARRNRSWEWLKSFAKSEILSVAAAEVKGDPGTRLSLREQLLKTQEDFEAGRIKPRIQVRGRDSVEPAVPVEPLSGNTIFGQ